MPTPEAPTSQERFVMRRIQLSRLAFFVAALSLFPAVVVLAKLETPWLGAITIVLLIALAALGLLFAHRDCPRCGRPQAPRTPSQSRPSTLLGFECPHCLLKVGPF